MRPRALDIALLACLALPLGCETTHPDRYPVMKSFHPDGSGGGVFPEKGALEGAEGVVFAYEAGDEIELVFTLDSESMHLKEPMTNVLVLDRPIRISADADGMLVSIDGGPWQAPLQAFTGSFATSLSMEKQDQANRGRLGLTAIRR